VRGKIMTQDKITIEELGRDLSILAEKIKRFLKQQNENREEELIGKAFREAVFHYSKPFSRGKPILPTKVWNHVLRQQKIKTLSGLREFLNAAVRPKNIGPKSLEFLREVLRIAEQMLEKQKAPH